MISYKKLKKQYVKLFRKADKLLIEHPDAELEYDEMTEADPTLGFKHKEDNVWIHTVFELKRYERKR